MIAVTSLLRATWHAFPHPPAASAPAPAPAPARLLGWRGYAAIAGGGLALVLIVAASVVLAIRDARALALAARTLGVQTAAAAVMEAVTDAESGQRGFLLTGDPSYLAPYRRAERTIAERLDLLARLTAPLAVESGIAADMRATATTKMGELAATVARATAGDQPGALALVRTNVGQRTMERLRNLSARLIAAQQGTLARQAAAVRDGGMLLVSVDVAGLGVILALAAGIAWGTRRAVRALRATQADLSAANAQLAAVNDRLEASVAERTADLTAANEEIQRFAYIVSHDLRAPLVNIMGFTGELETATQTVTRFLDAARGRLGEDLSPDVRAAVAEDFPEAIRFIKASTAKMDRLIAAILRLSREGRRLLHPEPVAPRPLALAIVESLAHQCAEQGAVIEVGALPDLVTDRLALEQVLSNLLDNAIKYLTPGRGGRITVRGRSDGAFAAFAIADNGRGIAAQDRERIFDLFRRAGDQTVPGEGIGLAHVRALVRRLGGTIDCQSTLDVGTTFHLRLPLVLRDAEH